MDQAKVYFANQFNLFIIIGLLLYSIKVSQRMAKGKMRKNENFIFSDYSCFSCFTFAEIKYSLMTMKNDTKINIHFNDKDIQALKRFKLSFSLLPSLTVNFVFNFSLFNKSC